MQQVNRLNELGQHVMYFSAKTIEQALQAAEQYAKDHGATAQRYFVQRPFGGTKSINIIADYMR